MKNKISKLIIICSLILSICLTPLLVSGVGVSAITAVDEQVMTIKFFSDNDKDSNDNLIPDSAGRITVGISIRKKNDGVSLTVKTRDKSALSSENDYESKTQEIQLTSTETSGDVEYFTVTAYQTNAANIVSDSEKYGTTRVFEIVLCDISTTSGCDYVIKDDWNGDEISSYNCRVKTQYDYEYTTKTNDSGMYFTDYIYGKSFATIYLDRSGVYTQTPSKKISFSVDDDSNYSFNSNNIKQFISSEYIAKYQETGFADVFYGGSAIISESGWCTSSEPAKLSLTDSDGKNIFYSEYYDPRSSGAPILFGETGYAEKGNDDYRYYLTNNAKTWLANNNGYYVYNTEDPMYKHAYCYYTNKNYNFSSVTGKVYKSNSKTINLKIERDSTWKMNFDYFRLDSELYDITAPKIVKTSLDNMSSTTNKVLRLSVRFSEPVHFPNSVGFDKSSLTISAKVNNNINDTLKFTYNGGDGTDTLYFDCDLNGFDLKKEIYKISLSDLAFDELKGYLFDYACNFNVKNNEADLTFSGVDFDAKIDMRSPSVKVTNTTYGTKLSSHTVEIKVDDMVANESKFYYTWVKVTDVGGNPESYTPTSYDNCETAQPTNFDIVEDKLDGDYYLFFMAKSAYGKETKGYFNHKLSFDNSAVEIDSVTFGSPNSALSTRTLNISLKGTTDDLKKVDLIYSEKGTTDEKTIQLYNGTATGKITSFTYNEGSKLSTASVELSGSDFGLNSGENKYFYFSFVTEDEVGNISETYYLLDAYLFDTHDKCNIGMSISGTPYTVYEEISVGSSTTVDKSTDNTYKNTYLAEGFELKFASESSSIELYALYKGDKNITSESVNYFTLMSSSNRYTMTYKSENGGGYFTIQLSADGKTSDSYSFYLVGDDDNVAGYCQTKNSNFVINKLYSVGVSSYYYLESSGTVATEYYNSASDHASLVFSSKARAQDYYEYMEKQDLSLVVITADIAKALNDTTHSNTNKAQDETTTAVAGQTWLRYKASSWNQSSDSSEWVYYYYSGKSETQIEQTKFSQILRNAIKQVATKIVDSGSFIYLTSDDGLNSVNMPNVAESRIRANSESASITKSGIPFKTSVSFVGDSEVYASTYTFDADSYMYSANELTASDYTIIKYKNHDGTDYVNLKVTSSYYLKDLINGTGVYDIIERDENGGRAYSVYIDNSAPEIKVSYKMNNSNTEVTVNESYAKTMGMLYVKDFNFISIEDTDDYAYVAVFSSSNGITKGSLYGTFLKDEINGVTLTNGSYIVEVCDRLGNIYSFVVNVSTENYAAECEINNVTNSYLRFTYKFPQDYIDIFEVYYDGILMYDKAAISTSLKNYINFTTAGEYRFYIKDKFGNVYEQTQKFVIELPTVTWYFEQNGSTVPYTTTDQVGLIVKQLGSTTYMVTSKSDVKFRFLKDNSYKYDFLSGSGTSASVSKYNEVTIAKTDENQNWQVKIYYEAYPDICITYIGKFDDSAPTISVTTTKTIYEYADENDEEIAEYLKNNKDTLSDGDIINWTDVSISKTTSTTETITSGETVSGSAVSVNVSDLSDIYKWTCNYNGKTTEYKTNKMVFNREGSYTITAIDKLGNESTFSFTIGKSEFTDIELDDIIPANFGEGVVNYNKSNVVASLDGEGSFSFIVNGEYFKLTTNGDNVLTRTIKKIKKSGDNISIEESKETFDLSSTVTLKETDTYTITAYLSGDTTYIVITIKDDADERVSVKMRVNSNVGTDAKYAECELSKECSYLEYEMESEKITGDLTENLYISKQCTVMKTDDVVSITIFYSATDDSLDDIVYTYKKGDVLTEYVCEKEGYYTLYVNNKYGNLSIIKIIYNTKVPVVASVRFSDDETISYSSDYEGELYSNKAVSVKVYNNTQVKITKGGVEYQADSKVVDGDSVTYTVSLDGEYIFTITDIYGNTVTKTAYIQSNGIGYSDAWLYGFNENALGKKDGYTNTKVSFNESKLKDSIYYISVIFGGETTKIYDVISENKTEFSDYQIGNDGDGEYTIVFRDKYGNKVLKTVFYRESAPLLASTLSRSLKKLFVELNSDTIELWSNKNITFDCPENNYEYKLMVDGENMSMPYSLSFPNESNYGKFTHTVTYIDQYGFLYTFNCVLYRTTIEVDDSKMTIVNSTTKDPVSISFNADYSAEISLNGENLGKYESGKNYFMDGSYIISVYDKAGNINNYAVKRDSVADFCFYTDSKENQLTNGEVTNESIVYFAPLNGDSVSYYTVYHDGEEVSDYDLTAFSESGKWEVVLIDEIGNKDYFCFYIITHSVSTFDYITPIGFTVNEATFDSGAGKVDWIECIKEKDGRYELNFEDSGTYNIIMVSDITGQTLDFELTIDKSVPDITLQGVENGGTTKNNVTISGYKSGDIIYIYKNGALNKTINVVSSSDVPEISEKGEYKIVVVNEAGGTSEVEFTRLYTANVVTSVLIIISILVVSVGLFTGLLFRKRSRIE